MPEFNFPVYRPYLGGNVKKYVNECIDSSWISSKGKFISLFEQSFAAFTGSRHAASVCNGTTALHLALVALGIQKGDEVIVPTLTYVASANAIAYTGATPVFVDSLADTWQMDPSDAARKITSRTKAILAVHLYGNSCDLDSLLDLCREHRLFLIEDCAEAFGTTYKGKHVGTFGDIGTFSFFGNKTITTGEGGMVICQDKLLHDRLVLFKGQGASATRHYWHDVVGYNYRMTNICAAIGLAQLEQADNIIASKKAIAKGYEQRLKHLPLRLHPNFEGVDHCFWMYSILAQDAEERNHLRHFLASEGVETRPFFYPIHSLPMYGEGRDRYPIAESLSCRGINLPSYPELTEEGLARIADLIRDFYLCSKSSSSSAAAAIAEVLPISI